jgi:hypothetical protein
VRSRKLVEGNSCTGSAMAAGALSEWQLRSTEVAQRSLRKKGGGQTERSQPRERERVVRLTDGNGAVAAQAKEGGGGTVDVPTIGFVGCSGWQQNLWLGRGCEAAPRRERGCAASYTAASSSSIGCKWALGDERTVMEASRGKWPWGWREGPTRRISLF